MICALGLLMGGGMCEDPPTAGAATNAMRLCGAKFGNLFLHEKGVFRAVAEASNLPTTSPMSDLASRTPPRYRSAMAEFHQVPGDAAFELATLGAYRLALRVIIQKKYLCALPQMKAKPRKLKVSGLPSPRRSRRSAAKRPNSMIRVFSG